MPWRYLGSRGNNNLRVLEAGLPGPVVQDGSSALLSQACLGCCDCNQVYYTFEKGASCPSCKKTARAVVQKDGPGLDFEVKRGREDVSLQKRLGDEKKEPCSKAGRSRLLHAWTAQGTCSLN